MRAQARIAITGVGAVSPFGEGAAVLWEAVSSGNAGIGPVARFDTTPFRSRLAATVRNFEPRKTIPPAVLRRLDLVSRYAVPAVAQALAQAAPASKERIGVVLGTNSAGSIPVAEMLSAMVTGGPSAAPPILFPYTVANAPASQCALILGLRGPNLTIAQKESSSALAITTACRILRSGGAEGILAGGSDEVSVHIFEVFDRLGVLSRDLTGEGGTGGVEGSRPFDRTRNGFVCGEGACFLFLETVERARSRGARVLALIAGAVEGRAPVAPHSFPVDPGPLARTVGRSLVDAGLDREGIDAVFASANSSFELDATEAGALRLAFEGRSGGIPPVCSVRGALGESGTGGAQSILCAVFAIRGGILPGTTGLHASDDALGLDVAPRARELPVQRALVTGFASGGAAAAIVVTAP